jgi:hypothetical protein
LTSAGRRAVALALLAAALPAAAWLASPSSVLRRMGQKREPLALATLEARGTLWASGETARALASAAGVASTGPEVSVEAVISLKAPGRCRIELVPAAGGATAAAAPYLAVSRAKSAGRGLDRIPAVVSLLRGACAFLAVRPGGADPGRAYAEELSRLGIPLDGDWLGKQGNRVAYVIGAPPRERRPQAWIDAQSWQPTRLIAALGGPLAEVRLLGWGTPPGGDAFPGQVEVQETGAPALRFSASRVASNPKVPDSLFP